jgi:hypothetical protein
MSLSGRKDNVHFLLCRKVSVLAQKVDPIKTIEAERSDQWRLCQYLERIADQLPDPITESDVESIYAILKHKLPIYHRNEEALYSLIVHNNPHNMLVSKAVALLVEEHRTQDCFAEEFHELFDPAGSARSIDGCGYMLRHVFETISRHLVWEDVILMPLAKEDLGKTDFEKLATKISLNSIGLLPGE